MPPLLTAYILRTGARLSPFGDDIGDVLILNRPLREHQLQVLRRFAAEVKEIDDLAELPRGPGRFLLCHDHLFFTAHLLRRVLREFRGPAAQVALADCAFVREKAPLGGLDLHEDGQGGRQALLPLWLWEGPGAPLEQAPPLPVLIKERTFVPENLQLLREGLELRYSITREGALSVRHWSHLLDANQIALAAFWIDFSPGRVLWLLWRALSALSLNQHRVARRVNIIGRRCDIHPTAFVAGSVLGDGVRIGPHSVVFGSVLGDGAQVEGLSELALSVVGARAVVSFRTRIFCSVLYPMAMASYPAMQMCLLGKRAMHMGGCFPIDMKLSLGELHDVKVRHQGAVAPSGKKFLGVCIGHGSIVGTGLWLQSGLEVPNGYLLVRDPSDVVTKIPEGLAGATLCFKDGVLSPR